jgi:hypothetical protein
VLATVVGVEIEQLTRTAGELDLFATKKLFAAWKDPEFFQKVEVGPYRQIRWSDEIPPSHMLWRGRQAH